MQLDKRELDRWITREDPMGDEDALVIQVPLSSWQSDALMEIYNFVQATPELGFIYRTALQDHVKGNEKLEPTMWAAYMNDELAGVATVGSHPRYPHTAKHGEITVRRDRRRMRIGTSLYFTQVLHAILKGRREIEDTIIPDLSPWMAGVGECGPGFLPVLGYTHYGTMPKRTSGFKDIMLWGTETLDAVDRYMDRLPDMLQRIELRETPKMRENFERNMHNYGQHVKGLIDRFEQQREWIHENFAVTVVDDVAK